MSAKSSVVEREIAESILLSKVVVKTSVEHEENPEMKVIPVFMPLYKKRINEEDLLRGVVAQFGIGSQSFTAGMKEAILKSVVDKTTDKTVEGITEVILPKAIRAEQAHTAKYIQAQRKRILDARIARRIEAAKQKFLKSPAGVALWPQATFPVVVSLSR